MPSLVLASTLQTAAWKDQTVVLIDSEIQRHIQTVPMRLCML